MKPAFEPITIARKPFTGTVAENVLEHGVGALAIDACRVGGSFVSGGGNNFDAWRIGEGREDRPTIHGVSGRAVVSGRFPANFIHDGSKEVEELFPETTSPKTYVRKSEGFSTGNSSCVGIGEGVGKSL